MNIAHRLAPLGATLTLAAVPTAALALTAAPAGAAPHTRTVTVRVEGLTRTLVPLTKVRLKSGGWILRAGVTKGACSTASALGALDLTTHHRWGGIVYSGSIFVDSILGVRYGKTAKHYWAFFAGNVYSQLGACNVTPRAGEPILFAAVPLTDSGDYVLGLSARGSAHAGQALTVKVVYYTATGKPRPLAGGDRDRPRGCRGDDRSPRAGHDHPDPRRHSRPHRRARRHEGEGRALGLRPAPRAEGRRQRLSLGTAVSPRAAHRLRTGLAVALAAAGLGGCGLGAGAGTGQATLTVTEHFGRTRIASASENAPGSETVMRMLERHVRLSTRYGGGFVQSIDGLAGGSERDWFFYVNGIEGAAGAAATALHRGDRVWWDFHDWRATDSVPAVVGAFPEPFRDGLGGARLRTLLECAPDSARACASVRTALRRAGATVATGALGRAPSERQIAVLVGPWAGLGPAHLTLGPAASGIYARFSAGGHALDLLDPAGTVAGRLGAGAGLIAATVAASGGPQWLITGTDAGGVAEAAGALSPGRLAGAFALAVQGTRALTLPLEPAA